MQPVMLVAALTLLAAPAPPLVLAQAPADPATGARPGHVPGIGDSLPRSDRASNIGPGTTREIAPTLPEPAVGDSADAREYLRTAREALATGRTGLAQQSLEMAETRMLDRVVPDGAIVPTSDATVMAIRQARAALGAGRRQEAMRILDAAGR